MKISSILGMVLYVLLSMILVPLALVSLNNYLKLPVFENMYLQLIGGLSVIAGGVLGLYAAWLFAKHGNGGSPLPVDPPKKLVTVGIFKYIRNPMFTASGMVWIGEFFFFGSFLLLPYAVSWVLINHIHLIKQDEKWLEKRYGKAYLEYKRQTPRYIPKFKN